MATAAGYDLGPATFPRGWFAVAPGVELGPRPISLRRLGRDLVAYRGGSGAPVVLDAYCAHMGTHLGSGQTSASARNGHQMSGDCIRCPLHGWQYGPDGQCVGTPSLPSDPPRNARVHSYPVTECAGLVMIWHDGHADIDSHPSFDPAPIPEFGDPAWAWTSIEPYGRFAVHQAEIIDHHVDRVHSVITHGGDAVERFASTFDGHRLSVASTSIVRGADGTESRRNAVSDYRGPGVMVVRIDGAASMVVFFAHTPVDDGDVECWSALAIRRTGDAAVDAATLGTVSAAMRQSFAEDMEILARKRPSLRAVEFPGDGPFRRARRWYTQFYRPTSEVSAIHADTDGTVVTGGEIRWPPTAIPSLEEAPL